MRSKNSNRNDNRRGGGNAERIFIEIRFCLDNRSNSMLLTINKRFISSLIPPLPVRKTERMRRTSKCCQRANAGIILRVEEANKRQTNQLLNYFPLMTSTRKSNGNRSSRPRFIDSHQGTARHLSYSLSKFFSFFLRFSFPHRRHLVVLLLFFPFSAHSFNA